MADETHEEDLSQLEDNDAVVNRVRELLDDGWKPDTLQLHREEQSKVSEPGVLRDDPKF